MNRLFYFLASVLFLLIILLLNSIFGTNSYSKKSQIINENNLQQEQNDELKKQNDALEFEIQNAQKSKEHVENFAREKLNLVYPDEEFITFKEEDKSEDEK